MDIFGALTMIGGLALFLYGMELMGDGLSRLSGGRMEQLLERLTSRKIMAVLLGMGVTAVIQSSSATTVMVVGFVNSGIMELGQVVGIIMGANVGTTVTSWLLSLTGIQGDNLLVSLLKPTSFAPVMAMIGVVILMATKSDRKKDVGYILLGFAILMTGMETMSGAVAPLADNEKFTGMLTMFSNPILGMIAGLVLTAVIQSSSASVGILQALALSGSISFGSAIPIIMGQNIGTCVTALLSSIGTSKNARRAAMIHLYFNLLGTIIFMIVFYAANAILDFHFLSQTASVAGIAIVHSIFNISATLLLYPFSNLLVKLAIRTIPDKPEQEGEQEDIHPDFARLEDRFLEQPGFALAEARIVTSNMAKQSLSAMVHSMGLFEVYSKSEAEKVLELENLVDQYEDHLGSYLVKLSHKDLSKENSDLLALMLHCIGDLERISDHALNIQETMEKMQDKNVKFSKEAKAELQVYSDAIRDILELAVMAFESGDLTIAKQIEPLEEVIDRINLEIKERHVDRLMAGICQADQGFALTNIASNLERVADHCSNIGVKLLELAQGEYDVHEYMETLHRRGNPEYDKNYNKYENQYRLPA